MAFDVLVRWVISVLLLSLRVAPVFALAPPFSLVRVPALVRVMMGLGLAAALVSAMPGTAMIATTDLGPIAIMAARELMLGVVFVLAFQLCFGALYMAGRTLDIQAGFGLAMLIDPTTRSQTPLIGTLFAYAAGMIFFSMGGHLELVRIIGASLDAIPLGAGHPPADLGRLTSFISVVFLASFGVAGGAILCLFLADAGIALLSRAAPQMNAMVLGFQLKTILLLLVLPTAFGFAGAALTRMIRITLQSLPGLL